MEARCPVQCFGLAVVLVAGLAAPSPSPASADPYRRLITVSDSVIVSIDGSGWPGSANHTVVLAGGVRQGNPDVSWTTRVFAYTPPVEIAATPAPDVAAFIGEHAAGAAAPVLTPGWPTTTVVLDGSAGEIGWFHSPDAGPRYSVFNSGALNIEVGGRVVWMIDRGLRVNLLTTVTNMGATPACLVIVAGRNLRDPDDPSAGTWFFGGLQSTDVPVYLVSDGRIYLEQFNYFDITTQVSNLAIFAHDVWFTGPRAGIGALMNLAHDPAVMDPLTDDLVARGALPVAPPPVPALDRWGAVLMVGLMAFAGALFLRATRPVG